jgi:hypothetical protein
LKKRLPLSAIITTIGAIITMLLLANYEQEKAVIKFYTLASSLLTAMLASTVLLLISEMRRNKK